MYVFKHGIHKTCITFFIAYIFLCMTIEISIIYLSTFNISTSALRHSL